MSGRNSKPKRVLSMKVEILTILFSYLSLRVFSRQYSDSVHILTSFGLDIAIVLWGLARLSSKADFYLKPSKQMGAQTATFVLAGWGTHFAATRLGLVIPFDASSLAINVFLLVFVPVFEELLFRQTLWKQLEALRLPKGAVWILTSILFSLYHLQQATFTPKEELTFIYYQTGYTLLGGLALGWVRQKQVSVAPSILLHAAFNLGFGLGVIG